MIISKSINRIKRYEGQSNNEFFWFLTNKLGFNVEICHNYFVNGTKMFTKWKNFLSLLELEPDEYNKELHMTRQQFIERATHRSVLDIEVMIDIDEKGYFNSIKEASENICERLKKANISFTCCFSGSKSYHISMLFRDLRDLDHYSRAEKKQKILNFLGADLQKASSRNMIALEGVAHWKTGKTKLEVDNNE